MIAEGIPPKFRIPENIVEQIRSNEINDQLLLKKINFILEQVDKSNFEIKKPDRSGLYDEKIYIPESKRKRWDKHPTESMNIKINGIYCHPLFSKLNNMLYRGISPIIAICGNQRYGKSKTGAYISYMLHNRLNILKDEINFKNQLIYDETEYASSIVSFKRKARICDEAEEYLNSYEHYSDYVRNVASALRTLSILENVEIIITPKIKNIAPRIREHIDFIILMKGRQKAKVTRIKNKKDKINSRGYDNVYLRYPDWKVPNLPKKYIEEYEKIETRYKGKNSFELLKNTLEGKIEERQESDIAEM